MNQPTDLPPESPPESQPGPPPEPQPDSDKEANQWAMFVHFSMFAGYVVPMAGLVVPIVLWQMKKDEFPIVDEHGKVVVNWLISAVIYAIICFPLTFILIGFAGYLALGIMSIVFPIIGGIKAGEGEVWQYPLSLKLIK
jgi:uncharacterized Tic20 family protein